jgi:hypothetical protein
MSDHDEPTEPVTAVPAVAQDDADAGGEPEPKSSLFAAVTGRRASIALVVVALVWLGVWAYTSDSAATSASVTTATAAPPARSPARRGQGHGGLKGSTTTLAPPPNLARTPQAYAAAFVDAWQRQDKTNASRVATTKAVSHLFARRALAKEQLTPTGCHAAGSFTNCTWNTSRRQLVVQVQNASGSTPLRVVGVTVHPL